MLAQYAYTAAGDRVEKTVTGPQATQERYVYGLQGELLGVYDVNGNPIEETAYLDDERPIALARPVTGSPGTWATYPILTDQLGTPREILDPNAGTPVWEWEAKEPFGNELPNQTVSGNTFIYRGRFPGQVYDLETGWIHNGFRDYDAMLGRYTQSDPMGLDAGWNTYTYVSQNPVLFLDENGLSGILTIYAKVGYFGGVFGHSWLGYQVDNGPFHTYGTWGNHPYGRERGNGLFEDIEKKWEYTAEEKLSVHINNEQENKLGRLLSEYKKEKGDAWTMSHNCSYFSSDVFYRVTGIDVRSSTMGVYTPNGVAEQIIHENTMPKNSDGH
jgi:RHS repeat-associated protein